MADYTAPEPYGLGLLTSLDAATATGAGAELSCLGARSYALDVRVTGAPTSFSVALEGTVNGTDWTTVGTAATAAGLTWAVDKPVARVRANLTALTGGTAPTVTVQVLAA